MDTERFGKFGTLAIRDNWWLDAEKPYPRVTPDQSNIELAKAICKHNKARGCRIEDEDALLDNQRHAAGINDVAFGNWRRDYGGLLRLINPEATLGWWRVGSE